jgi:hypothetical protein
VRRSDILGSVWNFILRRPTSVLIVGYFVAWGGLLASSNGIYWDDWVLYGVGGDAIVENYRQYGRPDIGILQAALIAGGPAVSSMVTWFAILFFGIICLRILEYVDGLSDGERLFAALVIVVAPLDLTRQMAINSPIWLGNLVFAFGWVLALRAARSNSRLVGGAAFAALAIGMSYSFTVALLPVAVCHTAWVYSQRVDLHAAITRSLIYIPTALPAIVAWTVWAPYGQYSEDDHRFSPQGIVILAFVFGAVALPALLVAWGRMHSLGNLGNALPVWMCGCAVGALCIALPLLIGEFPPYFGLRTRFQALVSTGLALILVAVLRALRPLGTRALRVALAIIALGAMSLLSAQTAYRYWFGWERQAAIARALRESDVVRGSELVIFDDRGSSSNLFHRQFSEYEWIGLLGYAFNDRSRYAVSVDFDNFNEYQRGEHTDKYGDGRAAWRVADYTPARTAAWVEIQNLPRSWFEAPAVTIAVSVREVDLPLTRESDG